MALEVLSLRPGWARVTVGVALFSPWPRGGKDPPAAQRGVFSPSTTHPAGSSSGKEHGELTVEIEVGRKECYPRQDTNYRADYRAQTIVRRLGRAHRASPGKLK
jgi:hypothetical protein